MDVTQAGGLGGALNAGFSSIDEWTKNIEGKMQEIANSKSEDQNIAMMQMQFEIGQYNAMIEMTSNITKTISDALKSVAQKI